MLLAVVLQIIGAALAVAAVFFGLGAAAALLAAGLVVFAAGVALERAA